MDAKQEFSLWALRLERKVWSGQGAKDDLEDCDRRIKEIEDWAAAGKAGVPRVWMNAFAGTLTHSMKHESDGPKCKRCGIERIYWEHFPDCSRFNEQNIV